MQLLKDNKPIGRKEKANAYTIQNAGGKIY